MEAERDLAQLSSKADALSGGALVDLLLPPLEAAVAAQDLVRSLEISRICHSRRHALESSREYEKTFRLLFEAGKSLSFGGSPELGLSLSPLIVRLADRLKDVAKQRMAWNFTCSVQIGVEELLGAYESAIQSYNYSDQMQYHRGKGSALNNLGIILTYLGQYQVGIDIYKAALAELQLSDPSDGSLITVSLSCLANLIFAYIQAEDFPRALVWCEEFWNSPKPKNLDETIAYASGEANAIEVLLRIGNVARARSHFEAVKTIVGTVPETRYQVWFGRIEALLAIHEGEREKGLCLLQNHLEFLRTNYKIDAELCLRDLVRVHESFGDYETALGWLRELIDLTHSRMLGAAMLRHRTHIGQMRLKTDSIADEVTLYAHSQRLEQASLASRRALENSLESLERTAVAATLPEDPTGRQIYRVGELSYRMALAIGVDEKQAHAIGIAARLRDIGKLWISRSELLLKQRRLTPDEMAIVQTHATSGAEMLAQCDLPQGKLVADIARYHHENWDGTGYPNGLAGSAIPAAARIVAFADVFDALTHARPHRHAVSVDKACEVIQQGAGTRFDPDLTPVFIKLIGELGLANAALGETFGSGGRHASNFDARDALGVVSGLAQGRSAKAGEASSGAESSE